MKADIYPEINTVAVIGVGLMGEGIALNFARAGLSVRVIDQSQSILNRCLARIGDNCLLFQEFDLLQETPSAVLSRIRPFLSTDLGQAVRDCRFIVECIPEILPLKRELLAQLDTCDPEVIISSNTSSFNVSVLTEGMRTPQRVVGTHYFMPAHIVPLVEVHWGKYTSDLVIETTRNLLLQNGKKPVLVRKEIPGFIVNRIQAAIAREANYLLEIGAVTPEDFDTAARASYGFRLASLGPLAQVDINGLDTVLRGNERIYKSLNNSTEISPYLVEKVSNGDLGLKSGKGYYDYTGRSADQIMRNIERNLLKQLQLFNERENP